MLYLGVAEERQNLDKSIFSGSEKRNKVQEKRVK
jgi:hypothetical protein